MVLFALSLLACEGCRHGQSATVSSEPEVVLQTRAGEQRVKVEVARTDDERRRGLMYRQKLEPGRGMIFLFPEPEHQKFWMKNTYIPLDMIFIDADKRVVYVEENAEPLTVQTRGPADDDKMTQFVLEVPGGWAGAHAVERGVAVRFVNID